MPKPGNRASEWDGYAIHFEDETRQGKQEAWTTDICWQPTRMLLLKTESGVKHLDDILCSVSSLYTRKGSDRGNPVFCASAYPFECLSSVHPIFQPERSVG